MGQTNSCRLCGVGSNQHQDGDDDVTDSQHSFGSVQDINNCTVAAETVGVKDQQQTVSSPSSSSSPDNNIAAPAPVQYVSLPLSSVAEEEPPNQPDSQQPSSRQQSVAMRSQPLLRHHRVRLDILSRYSRGWIFRASPSRVFFHHWLVTSKGSLFPLAGSNHKSNPGYSFFFYSLK